MYEFHSCNIPAFIVEHTMYNLLPCILLRCQPNAVTPETKPGKKQLIVRQTSGLQSLPIPHSASSRSPAVPCFLFRQVDPQSFVYVHNSVQTSQIARDLSW